jgi:hypothetical protein
MSIHDEIDPNRTFGQNDLLLWPVATPASSSQLELPARMILMHGAMLTGRTI